METAAITIIIILGVFLLIILVALIAVLFMLRNLLMTLNEKIDPILETVDSFANSMNENVNKKRGSILMTIYKYASVIPAVLKEQKQKYSDIQDDDDEI